MMYLISILLNYQMNGFNIGLNYYLISTYPVHINSRCIQPFIQDLILTINNFTRQRINIKVYFCRE